MATKLNAIRKLQAATVKSIFQDMSIMDIANDMWHSQVYIPIRKDGVLARSRMRNVQIDYIGGNATKIYEHEILLKLQWRGDVIKVYVYTPQWVKLAQFEVTPEANIPFRLSSLVRVLNSIKSNGACNCG